MSINRTQSKQSKSVCFLLVADLKCRSISSKSCPCLLICDTLIIKLYGPLDSNWSSKTEYFLKLGLHNLLIEESNGVSASLMYIVDAYLIISSDNLFGVIIGM